MDLEKTIEDALEDATEYGVTEGEYDLDRNKAVYIAPPDQYETGKTSIIGDIRNWLRGEPETFIVRIYEGNDVIASTEAGTVGEAEEWLGSNL